MANRQQTQLAYGVEGEIKLEAENNFGQFRTKEDVEQNVLAAIDNMLSWVENKNDLRKIRTIKKSKKRQEKIVNEICEDNDIKDTGIDNLKDAMTAWDDMSEEQRKNALKAIKHNPDLYKATGKEISVYEWSGDLFNHIKGNYTHNSPVRKIREDKKETYKAKATVAAAKGVNNFGLIAIIGGAIGLYLMYTKKSSAANGPVLAGTVKDGSTGLPIKGAAVNVLATDGESLTAMTDSNGAYSIIFKNVTNGTLQVLATGYQSFSGSFSLSASTTTINVTISSNGSNPPQATVTPTNGLDTITTFPSQVKISSTTGANVRSSPSATSTVIGVQNYGATFMVSGFTLGELYQGENRWWLYNGGFVWVGNTYQSPAANLTPTVQSSNSAQPVVQPIPNSVPQTGSATSGNSTPTTSTTQPVPQSLIMNGKIVDALTGQGVSGAIVSAAGQSAVTDNNGNFSIIFSSIFSGGTATITKSGYSTANQSFSFTNSSTINLTIPFAPTSNVVSGNSGSTTPSTLPSSSTYTPTPQNNTQYYTIQNGDTLSGIAVKYGTTVTYLMSINPQITNANNIYAGQSILVPTTNTTVSVSVSPSPISQYPMNVTVNSTIGANIRSAPNTSSSVIGTVVYGGQFTATGAVSGEAVSGLSLWWVKSGGGYVWQGSTSQKS